MTAMAPPSAPPLADAEARARIRSERAQNLLVIAGAGTGKTASIIDRVRAFLDPESANSGASPVELDRLAVITFTRRAAGELRFRLREELLSAVASTREPERRRRLESALLALDSGDHHLPQLRRSLAEAPADRGPAETGLHLGRGRD